MKYNEIIDAIRLEKPIDTVLDDGSISVRISDYVPYICTAIHSGHNMPEKLQEICNLTEDERLQEEDPYTGQILESFPLTLISHDSRYEYDLNRDQNSCIYEEAWGKKVWRKKRTDSDKLDSLKKHSIYYSILKEILDVLEKKFGGVLLIDLHSYNWKVRSYDYAPVFNIGTKQINTKRWGKVLSVLEKHISEIDLPNLEVSCERNVVYKGEGYQAAFVSQHVSNTLIVPLEIKKIYMDELCGEPFPIVIEELSQGLYFSVLEAASCLFDECSKNKIKASDLYPSEIEPVVFKIDKQLYRLAKGFETLNYVNPINFQAEKKRFMNKRDYVPKFKYRQLRIDPYLFKEYLYKLPVSDIQDPIIRDIYRSVIDGYAMKVELLTSVGTNQFLYNSLRYYGEPNTIDIENAQFLLHASKKYFSSDDGHNNQLVSVEDAVHQFQASADKMNLNCKVVLSKRIAAKAMVDNLQRKLYVNQNASLTKIDIQALVHHELGVHMVTTQNALLQPLNVLKLGLPGNTYTQEGLAILSEYLSGTLTLSRLQQLALRVLAIDMMVKGSSFSHVYRHLNEQYGMSSDDSFALAVRVYRGGGFTKDYLYLSGFRDMLAEYKKGDILSLLIGKTGIKFHAALDSLIERKIFSPPAYVTPAFKMHCHNKDAVLDYLVESIK
ncbi:MAG: flavohemoglobin expression-modulating QEGLA motif protein [Coxiellaceae bacterium]|nr:flavohemoglobin expression-modulating QEGLA motif protein [Coxiellaceae bacterium]